MRRFFSGYDDVEKAVAVLEQPAYEFSTSASGDLSEYDEYPTIRDVCSSITLDLTWNGMFTLSIFRLIDIQIVRFDGFQLIICIDIPIINCRTVVKFRTGKIFIGSWSSTGIEDIIA